MATPSYNDSLMTSLAAQAPGTIADRERKRLEAATGLVKKSLADMYKTAGEVKRIAGQKLSSFKSIWSNAQTATEYYNSGGISVGLVVKANTAITIKGIRFYKALNTVGTCDFAIYDSAQVLKTSGSIVAVAGAGWVSCIFGTPFTPTIGTYYILVVHTPDVVNNYVTIPVSLAVRTDTSDGAISTLATPDTFAGNVAAGRFIGGGTIAFPTSTTNTNYGVDILY